MTLWQRLVEIVNKIKADNGRGLAITAGVDGITITKEIEVMGGSSAGKTTRIQRMSLTPVEVQWLSNQFTRIFAEEQKDT